MHLAVQTPGESMAMASDRVEVDTARPFRSVREAVAVFGERILVGECHSRPNANADSIANHQANSTAKHENSSSSSTITLSPNAMAGIETGPEAATPAIAPMYSAPSSPPSFASSRSPDEDDDGAHRGQDEQPGLTIMSSIKRLEAEVSETKREVAYLKKRGAEMDMAVASLNAQLHRGLSRLAEMEADKAAAARRSVGGDTDVTMATLRSERWAEKSAAYSAEYLPSFSHALSLGEVDIDDELIGRRRKAQKVKPVVPLIGDILFYKRKSTKDSGDVYSMLGC